jgi:alpha-L-fucosidase
MKLSPKTLLQALLVSFLLIAETAPAQYPVPSKSRWWYEARFGMFIHFGSYSFLGRGEWAFFTDRYSKTKYQSDVSAHFNPVKFDAGAIARAAKRAGMKYIVITAKHHEGFCMWPTAVQSFKDSSGTRLFDLPDYTSFGSRDVLQELKKACDAEGIKFCLYYSIMDWCHASQKVNHATYYSDMLSPEARTAYIDDMKVQLRELIIRYHPAVMWFDGDWTYHDGVPTPEKWWTRADGRALYAYMMGLDSTLILNERVCRGFGLGDFECPEQVVPDAPLARQWETCRTMNGSWGYNAADTSYKSPKSLIQEMVKTVSRDGNYLLNIGPKGDGTLTEESLAILEDFGSWMDLHSESIYGTTRSPFPAEPEWGFYTKKAGKLYAHVLEWPADGKLTVPRIANALIRVYLLNDRTRTLDFVMSPEHIDIALPAQAPDVIDSVIVLELAGMPSVTPEGTGTGEHGL